MTLMSVFCEFNVYGNLQFSNNELTLTRETAIINAVLSYPIDGNVI